MTKVSLRYNSRAIKSHCSPNLWEAPINQRRPHNTHNGGCMLWHQQPPPQDFPTTFRITPGTFGPHVLMDSHPRIMFTQVHVPNTQWGQISWNVGVWSRERFIAGLCKETRWPHALKGLKLLNDFWQSIFKRAVRERGCRVGDELVQFSDGLMVRQQVVSQGWTWPVLRLQEAWGSVLMTIR